MRKLVTAQVAFWFGALFLTVTTSAAAATSDERLFAVLVDGKPAGEFHLTYTSRDDGSLRISGSASVKVRALLKIYRYDFTGTEVWKGDRLQGINCSSNDDGTRCALHGAARADGLHLVVNGSESVIQSDVATTTWWQRPANAGREGTRAVLDVDTGRVPDFTISLKGPVKVTVAGQAIEATQYHVSRPSITADLWYDAQGRLVRQSTLEDGHRTVLERRH